MRLSIRLVTIAAALAASGGLVAGCGSSSSQRPAVARYIRQVARIEASLAAPLAAVTHASSDFAQSQGTRARLVNRLVGASAEPKLLAALGRIEALRRQLAAVAAPAQGRRLRSLLLRLIALEASTTREVAMLAAFVPRFAAALRPLGPATRRLELALSRRSANGAAAVAAAYRAKAAALRGFQSSVDAVLRRLRRLQPPAVSTPGYRAQVRALAGMSASAGKLAGSLADGPRGDVERLLTDFDRAAVSSQSDTAQKAQIAAIRAYDSHSDQLAALATQIDRERARLGDTLH